MAMLTVTLLLGAAAFAVADPGTPASQHFQSPECPGDCVSSRSIGSDATSLLQVQGTIELGSARSAEEGFPSDATSLLQVQSSVQLHDTEAMTLSAAKSLEREIPKWLEAAITYLEEGKEGGIPFMDLEGIWRKAGNKQEVEELVNAWNDGGSSVTAGTCFKTVTSAISSMLHQTPLFSDSLASTIAFMVSGRSGLNINPELQNKNRWMMLNTYLSDPEDISRERLSELKALMAHWHKVVEHEAKNQMSYGVMATCASPMLFVGEMMGKKRTIDATGKSSFKNVPYLATMDAFATQGSVFVENVAFMIENPARVGDPADVPPDE